jgi:hypothetical protein
MMSWSIDIERILEDMRTNSVYLSQHHKRRYFYYKNVGTWFKIPTIIISSIASVASVGLTTYVSQQHISGIVCLMSLSVGIINSIELYLRIQDNLEIELTTSKSYYNLSIDLHKLLNLSAINRQGEPIDILNQYYDKYISLVEDSNLLSVYYPDKLARLPPKLKNIFSRSTGSSSGSSNSSINTNPIECSEVEI